MTITIRVGDCLSVMRTISEASVDSVVTDPPYGLSFMGKQWDRGLPGVLFWRQVIRVLRPGAHLLAFGGTRTHHRLMCAIEDAGFEIRDVVMWVYGTGFPKSLDVSKAIDKAAGAERIESVWRDRYHDGGTRRELGNDHHAHKVYNAPPTANTNRVFLPATDAAKQWDGWGTALKPAWEPIIVARKPLDGTVAANVLEHGTGALNIDGCRVETKTRPNRQPDRGRMTGNTWQGGLDGSLCGSKAVGMTTQGRWPANLIHDGSDEVVELFPQSAAGHVPRQRGRGGISTSGHAGQAVIEEHLGKGSTARFFYCAKASRSERDLGLESQPVLSGGELTNRKDDSPGTKSPRAGAGRTSGGRNTHPTVKPIALMRYLCRLVTPPNGVILDPFAGSGSTGVAAKLEGFSFIGIEVDEDYCKTARRRIRFARAGESVTRGWRGMRKK